MSALTTLSEWPTCSYVGDTIIVRITDSDRTAPTWGYTFSFRGVDGSAINVTATTDADGTSHLVSVAAVTSQTWLAGTYSGVGSAFTTAGERFTLWRGTWELKANLVDQPDNYDSRSWAKRCLDKIEAVIEGRASRDVLNSTIAGQAIARMTPEQLFKMRDQFRAEYQQELEKELAAQGKSAGGVIGFKFTNP